MLYILLTIVFGVAYSSTFINDSDFLAAKSYCYQLNVQDPKCLEYALSVVRGAIDAQKMSVSMGAEAILWMLSSPPQAYLCCGVSSMQVPDASAVEKQCAWLMDLAAQEADDQMEQGEIFGGFSYSMRKVSGVVWLKS